MSLNQNKRKGLRLDKDYYTLLFFEKRMSHLIEKYKCKETNEMYCKEAGCFEFIFIVLFTEIYCLQTETMDTLTKKQGNLEL